MGEPSKLRRAGPARATSAGALLALATAAACAGNPFAGQEALPGVPVSTWAGARTSSAMDGATHTAASPVPARRAVLRTGTRRLHVGGEAHAGRQVWVTPLGEDRRRLALLDGNRGLVVLDLAGDRITVAGQLPVHADPLDLVSSGNHLYVVTQGEGDSYEVTVATAPSRGLTRVTSTQHKGYYAGLWATAGDDGRDHVYLIDSVPEPHSHRSACSWPGALQIRAGIIDGQALRWEAALQLPKRYGSVTREGPFLLPSSTLGHAPNRPLFAAATKHLIDLRPHLQLSQPPVQTPAPTGLELFAATYAKGTLWLAGKARKSDGSVGFELRSFGSERQTRCDLHGRPVEKRAHTWALEGPIDIMIEGGVARVQHSFLPPHPQLASTIDLDTCSEEVDAQAGRHQWLLEEKGVLLGGETPEVELSLVTGLGSSRAYRIPVAPDTAHVVPVLGDDAVAIDVPAIASTTHAYDRHFLLPPSGQALELHGAPISLTDEGRILLLSERGLQLVNRGGQELDALPQWAVDKGGALLGDTTMRVRYEGLDERPERNSERAFLPASRGRSGPALLRIIEPGGDYKRVSDLLVRLDPRSEPCRIDIYDLHRPGPPRARLESDVACKTRFEREGHGAGPAVELRATRKALIFSQPEGRFEKTAAYSYEQRSRELVNYVLDLSDPESPKLHGPLRTRAGEFVTQTFVRGDILNLVVRPQVSTAEGTRFVRGVDLQDPAEPHALPPFAIPGRLVARTERRQFSVFSAAEAAPSHIVAHETQAQVQYEFGARQIADVVPAGEHLLVIHYPLPGKHRWAKRPATLAILDAETLHPMGALALRNPVRVLSADSRFALVASDDPCTDGIQHLLIGLHVPRTPRILGALRSFTLLDTQGDEVLILRNGELERLRLRDLIGLLIEPAP